MSLTERALEVLERGPATSPELAVRLGLPVARAAVVLSRLAARNVVTRVDDGRKPYRYALATGARS